MIKDEIAAIWDIENVTPSYDNMFVDGLFTYIDSIGHLSLALAIADWRSNISPALALNLSEKGFELTHIPQPEKKARRRKNSSDLVIITKATEIIFQYPHISVFILITGDIDFRPLLQTLKRYGKKTIIICDSNTASERLLEFADEYMDYRNLLPDDETDSQSQDSGYIDLNKKDAFKLLAEAVDFMIRHEKKPTPGSVKIRMKLLNEDFSGDVIGFSQWNAFIRQAEKEKVINIEDTDKGLELSLPAAGPAAPGGHINATHEIFRLLIGVIEENNPKNKWINFSQVSVLLSEKGISIKDYNYGQLKKLIIDAEKRGLVEVKNVAFKWAVRIKNQA